MKRARSKKKVGVERRINVLAEREADVSAPCSGDHLDVDRYTGDREAFSLPAHSQTHTHHVLEKDTLSV